MGSPQSQFCQWRRSLSKAMGHFWVSAPSFSICGVLDKSVNLFQPLFPYLQDTDYIIYNKTEDLKAFWRVKVKF